MQNSLVTRSSRLYWFLALSLSICTLSFSQSLSGSYSISKSSGDFNSFSSAIKALHFYGVEGPVTFLIEDGVYHESDTISEIRNSSSTNTITFAAANKDSAQVILEWDSRATGDWNLRLDHASHLIFKGITFIQLFDHAKQNVLLVSCHDLKFENCRFEGSDMIGDGTLLGGTVDSNLSITNCVFDFARKGVNVSAREGRQCSNIQIKGCQFNTQNLGIRLSNLDQLTIANNKLKNINGGRYTGLLIQNSKAVYVKQNSFKVNSSSNYSRAVALENITSRAKNTSLVANNMVDMNSDTGQEVAVLKLRKCKSLLVAHNNFRIISKSKNHSVINLSTEKNEYVGVSLINNILSNEGNGLVSNHLKFKSEELKSDYNLLYTESGSISSEYSDMTTLQRMGKSNSHSFFEKPNFTKGKTLKAQTKKIDSTALPLDLISEDFNNEHRNKTVPDIGAYEYLKTPRLEIGPDTIICEKLVLKAESDGQEWNWSNGIKGLEAEIKTSGIYWVEARNGDGVSYDSVSVEIKALHQQHLISTPSINEHSKCVEISTMHSSNELNYLWLDSLGNSLGEQTTLSVCPTDFPIQYWLQTTNELGCSRIDSITINSSKEFAFNSFNTELNGLEKPVDGQTISGQYNAVTLYPNPAEGYTNVSFNTHHELKSIWLTDMAGNIVFSNNYKILETGKYQLNLTKLKAGTYTVVIETNREVYRLPLSKF